MSPLLPALVALFVGTAGIPIVFKRLMVQVPELNAIWAILSPIHGFLIYSAILGVLRPPVGERKFNPLYAIPISALFGLYNVMKGQCGQGTAVPGIIVHLTDQLEPLVVMGISIALGIRRDFPALQWAAAVVLLSATIWYILNNLSSSLDASPFQLTLCVTKSVPVGAAFLYVEWILTVSFPSLFPTVLWWWICVFQIFTTLVPAYFSFSPGGDGDEGFLQFIRRGVACYWFAQPGTECSEMPKWNVINVFFGSMMNIAMPVVARYGGAPILMMIRAASLPVVAFLFTLPFLVGDEADTLDFQKILGLASATLALVMWSLAARRHREQEDSARSPLPELREPRHGEGEI